jgi:hypothetical protein
MHAPLSILPGVLPAISGTLAMALAGIGVILWLGGAVWSRSLVTLILVAIGTWIGMRMPGWAGWRIDGMGPAIGGAIVLGAAGYLLHRAWIGLVLAMVLAAWAGGGVWIAMDRQGGDALARADHLDAPRETVSVSASTTLSAFGRGVGEQWQKVEPLLQPRTNQFVLGAAVLGLLVGGMVAVRWPRLSQAMAWSLLGITLAVTMGTVVIQKSKPDLMDRLPARAAQPISQFAGILLLAVVGTALQYYLAARGGMGEWAMAMKSNDDGED